MKKVLISLTSALLPLTAFAQPTLQPVVTSYSGVIGVINIIGNWMFGILLALAVIFIVYAAFLYLTAAGDEKKIGQAKDIIIYAVVAIVVAVLAKGIVMVVQTLVTGTAQTP